jgi:hypothetical protein
MVGEIGSCGVGEKSTPSHNLHAFWTELMKEVKIWQ